jgi:hypothetical protein
LAAQKWGGQLIIPDDLLLSGIKMIIAAIGSGA